jgi:hypothetical protein
VVPVSGAVIVPVVTYDDQGEMVVERARLGPEALKEILGRPDSASQYLYARYDDADECRRCEEVIQASDDRITGGGPVCARCSAELERGAERKRRGVA